MAIYQLLKTGKDNAVSRDYLLQATGIHSQRGLYETVACERREGHAILSNHKGGYYLADTQTARGRRDVIDSVRRLESMGKQNLKAAAYLRRAVSDVIGQAEFDFDDSEAIAADRRGGGHGNRFQ